MTDLGTGSILIIVLFGPIIIGLAYLFANRLYLRDIWNLRFRRARTCRADMHTGSNRVFTRYVVPDSRRHFRHKKGVYVFPKENFETDAKYGIPKADFLEGQIEDETGDVILSEVEVPVKETQADGSMKEVMKPIPQFLISHSKIKPKLLHLARRDEKGVLRNSPVPPVTAMEMAEALDSKMADRITAAKMMDAKIQQVFIIIIINLVLLILIGVSLYSKMNSIDGHLQVIQDFLTKPIGGH